jgi:hypothetical protein
MNAITPQEVLKASLPIQPVYLAIDQDQNSLLLVFDKEAYAEFMEEPEPTKAAIQKLGFDRWAFHRDGEPCRIRRENLSPLVVGKLF